MSESAASNAMPPRRSAEQLAEDVAAVGRHQVVGGILEAVSGLMAVLDEGRQVLAVNPILLDFLDQRPAAEVLGMRLGEALSCRMADQGSDGCGTGPGCPNCGAALAHLAAKTEDHSAEELCALTRTRGDGQREDLLLRARVSPIDVDGRRFFLVLLLDLSNEERALSMQRSFLHDLNNHVGGLVGAIDLLSLPGSQVTPELLQELATRVMQEIDLQRVVVEHRGEHPHPALMPLAINPLLVDLRHQAVAMIGTGGRRCLLQCPQDRIMVRSDQVMLMRVLINMITNAIEASPPKGEITIGVDLSDPATVQICVHNQGWIPEDVQARIFQCHFSTKGQRGRGLGTWTMRMLCERFLDARVDFQSDPQSGTRFCVHVPRIEE